MSIEYLEWDSTFFNIKVGRILNTEPDLSSTKLNLLLTNAKEHSYNLIYFFSDQFFSINNEILDKYSGRLIDRKVVFQGKTFDYQINSTGLSTRDYSLSEYNDELLDLAYVSGEYSRYRTDPNFGEVAFKKLYKIWIENSVKQIIADKVFIVELNGKIKGMVTVKIKENFGEIGLIAVDPSSQGKGIGCELINVVKKYLIGKNIKDLKVATQLDNVSACSFYRKCNLFEESINNIYHFWL